MKTITVTEFKARCLAVFRDVETRGEGYVITRRGEPIARVVPVATGPRRRFGSMKATVSTTGDIISPAAPLSVWKALRRPKRRGRP